MKVHSFDGDFKNALSERVEFLGFALELQLKVVMAVCRGKKLGDPPTVSSARIRKGELTRREYPARAVAGHVPPSPARQPGHFSTDLSRRSGFRSRTAER